MTDSGAASSGLAGMRVRISSKVCTMCTPSRLPAPPAHFSRRRSSCKAGADHQARWAGGWGGEGSELEVPERQWPGLGVKDAYGRREEWEARRGSWGEGVVDMGRRWRALRCPGERERRWRGLGVEDAYGRRGEREARCCSRWEGDADMGRRRRAWRRPGERERRWRGLVVEDAYGRRGEQEAWWGSWGGGGGLWTWDGAGGGLGWRTRTGGAGKGTHGAARRGRGMWTWDGGGVRGGPRGSGSGGIGALGGRGAALGSGSGASERLRCGCAVGSVSAGDGSAVWRGNGSAAVCGTRSRRGARLASGEAAAAPGRSLVVPPGTGG